MFRVHLFFPLANGLFRFSFSISVLAVLLPYFIEICQVDQGMLQRMPQYGMIMGVKRGAMRSMAS
jgi:hypothetical protein